MLSIVSVFNDPAVLGDRLLSSLSSQNAPHEVVTVNNTEGQFDRATTALNWGGEQAHGDWVVFVHQDVQLLSADWLGRAEKLLELLPSDGWSGVAGFTQKSKLRGMIRDRAMLLGSPFQRPAEVQTLDECLLIHRRGPAGYKYFDEGIAGWHAYGVDACCTAIRSGAKNYVLPLPVWHDSKSSNLQGLEEAHRYVWDKHGAALKKISTTCGDLPSCYRWSREPRTEWFKAMGRRLQTSFYHRLGGYPGAFTRKSEELLESLTESEDLIECLHAPAWHDTIETKGFVQHPERERRILHHFIGWDFRKSQSDCVVVTADLTQTVETSIEKLRDLRKRTRRLLVCVDGTNQSAVLKGWRELRQEARVAEMTRHWDGTPSVILEF
jgi:hypothetical protein